MLSDRFNLGCVDSSFDNLLGNLLCYDRAQIHKIQWRIQFISFWHFQHFMELESLFLNSSLTLIQR